MIASYNFRDFKKNESDREIDNTYPFTYHCSVVRSDIRNIIGGSIPIHWHHDIEIACMVDGEAELYVGQDLIHLRQGEALFINANAMHTLRAVSSSVPAGLITVRFHPDYLGGTSQTDLFARYVAPIVNNSGFSCFHIRASQTAGLKMLSSLNHLIEICQEEPPGYELRMHNLVTDFWCELFFSTEQERKRHSQILSNEHMRPMLDFIQTHLTARIELSDIASAGLVSTRECSRLFRKYVHQSPVSYVNFCRLRQAAALLLSTENNITEIGEDCGFSSLSYFSKMFEREFGLRPMEYRKQFRNVN